MGKNYLNRFVIGGTILSVAGFFALLPFTNCSQNPQGADVPQSAFLNPTQRYDALKAEFKGRVPLAFCQSSEAYGCIKKIYSAEVSSGQMPSTQECTSLSGDLKLCPVIQIFNFNSQSAAANCQGCKETYEYLEYSCHLKIPNSENVYPIVMTKPTLDQSLSDLYQFCAIIAEEVVEKQK